MRSDYRDDPGPQRLGVADAQRRLPHQPPAARRHAPLRRRRRGRPGRRRRRRRRQRPHPAAGPRRLARRRAWTPGRSGTPTPTGSATNAARTPCTGPTRARSAAQTRCRWGPTTPAAASAARWSTTPATPPASTRPTSTPSPPTGSAPTGPSATTTSSRTTSRSRPNCRSPGRTGPGATRTATRTSPHPVGGNGEIFLRGAAAAGIDSPGRPGRDPQRPLRQPAALHLPRLLPAGLQGQRQGQPADHPHPRRPRPRRRDPPRQPRHPGRSSTTAPAAVTGVTYLPRRRGAPPAGPRGRRRRLLHRNAAAAAAVGHQPLPGRAGQRPRPGRPLPDGAGRPADRRPVRRRDPDVQGAAAGGQQRTVLRDRPDQALQARLVHPDRQPAADHLGRTRYRPRTLGRTAARVHARLRALGHPRRALRITCPNPTTGSPWPTRRTATACPSRTSPTAKCDNDKQLIQAATRRRWRPSCTPPAPRRSSPSTATPTWSAAPGWPPAPEDGVVDADHRVFGVAEPLHRRRQRRCPPRAPPTPR